MLGSTGSIGTQALDVIRRHPDASRSSGWPPAVRGRSCSPPRPRSSPAPGWRSTAVSRRAGTARRPPLLTGPDAATELVATTDADVVLNGITGSIGLAPTLAALDAGRVLALGQQGIAGRRRVAGDRAAAPGQIVPVDSEHSALAQCLRGGRAVRGGPAGADRLRRPVPRPVRRRAGDRHRRPQALAHPTWAMGPVVTINSATLVNKGLELIEAHLLFEVPYERIETVVHPQSVIHSMVTFVDGSTLAQASPPDMRLPIALGLCWPDRLPDVAAACDFGSPASWTFEPVDHEAFPALGLARTRRGGGRHRPGGLQRRERGSGGGFPDRSSVVHRHFPVVVPHPGRGRNTCAVNRGTSRTSLTPRSGPGSGPAS